MTFNTGRETIIKVSEYPTQSVAKNVISLYTEQSNKTSQINVATGKEKTATVLGTKQELKLNTAHEKVIL